MYKRYNENLATYYFFNCLRYTVQMALPLKFNEKNKSLVSGHID